MTDNITAQRITYLRELRGLLQPDLAQLAQIEQSYVSKLERGKAPNVSGVVLVRIARALETTVDFLLGNSDNPNPHPAPNHPILHDSYFPELAAAWSTFDKNAKKTLVAVMALMVAKQKRNAERDSATKT